MSGLLHGATSIGENTVPALEDDLPSIEALDQARTNAIELRETGLRVLRAALERDADPTADCPDYEHWAKPESAEPADCVRPALVALALKQDVSQRLAQLAREDDPCTRQLDDLAKAEMLDLKTLFPRAGQCTTDSTATRVPILQAARSLQAFSSDPRHTLSKASMLCFYTVVRELHSIDPPDWTVGSARASEGGAPTAFMTGECSRAVKQLALTIDRTARLLTKLRALYSDLVDLLDNPCLPEAWRNGEVRRLCELHYTTLSTLAPRASVSIEPDLLDKLVRIPDTEDLDERRKPVDKPRKPVDERRKRVDEFVLEFIRQFKVRSEAACAALAQASEEIRVHRDQETLDEKHRRLQRSETGSRQSATTSSDESPWGRRWESTRFGHDVGRHAVHRAKLLAEHSVLVSTELKTAFESFVKESDEPGKRAKPPSMRELDSLIEMLTNEYNEVLKILEPARHFIEHVLDHELSAHAAGGSNLWNAPELAFAAASYGHLAGFGDERLQRARQFLIDAMSPTGEYATELSLDTDHRSYSLDVVGFEVQRAVAVILERVKVVLDPAVILRMLAYFDATAIRKMEGKEILGWGHDKPQYPRRAYRWTTALAILALHRLIKMLDKRINARIYRHFTVRRPTELRWGPWLKDLFVTDYGLSAPSTPENVARNVKHGLEDDHTPEVRLREESVIFALEAMRAHVVGAPIPKGRRGRVYSTVLHGPPGTGKTTVLEALAASSGVNLVEITPSDIIVTGEEMLERRARAVFAALSMLTRTVILLDEFDEVLRDRVLASSNASSAMRFLTPGMLPKLRALNIQAKRRRVAFALLTNRIGTLDSAAVRNGRFDSKYGIYPPDATSRAGRLCQEIAKAKRLIALAKARLEKRQGMTPSRAVDPRLARLASVDFDMDRVAEIVVATAGGGMQNLAVRGAFTMPKDVSNPAPGSLFEYFTTIDDKPAHSAGTKPPAIGSPDARFRQQIDGGGIDVEREFVQWSWTRLCDETVRNAVDDAKAAVKAKAKAKAKAEAKTGAPPAGGDDGSDGEEPPKEPKETPLWAAVIKRCTKPRRGAVKRFSRALELPDAMD